MTSEPAAQRREAWDRAALPLPHTLALLAVALLAMLPAVGWNAMVGAHDTHHHLRWQAHFADLLWGGVAYPRWLPNVNEGFGSPAFFIYPPLAHYVGALFRPVLGNPDGVVLRVALSATIALLAGGWGTAVWLRERGLSPVARLAGALAYMLAPYHFYADTYLRGALPELWAFAPFPFILAGIAIGARRPLRSLLVTTLGTAALVLSHAPSLLIALPAACLYALTLAIAKRRWRILAQTAVAFLLAFALAAPYLATALTQDSLIASWNLFDDYFRSSRWLLGSGVPWPSPDVGPPILVVAAAQVGVCLLFLFGGRSGGWQRPDRLFALAMLVGTVILTTEIGRAFWLLETPLNRVQFPWRLLMLQAVPLSLLAAEAWEQPRRPTRRWLTAAGILILAATNIGLSDRLSPWRTAPVEMLDWQTFYEPPEYVLGDPWDLHLVFADGAKTVALDATAHASVTRWDSRHIAFTVTTDVPGRIALRQYSYSGWRYRIDGGAEEAAGRWSSERPVVTVEVPAGRHEVEVRMPPLPAERAGWWISLGGLLVLVGLVWRLCRRSDAQTSRAS